MATKQLLAGLAITLALTFCAPQPDERAINNQDQTSPEELTLAQQIVNEAIAKHGGNRYERAHLEFDFRGRHYTSTRNNGRFVYERIFNDTLSGQPVVVTDVLNNDGFKRMVGSDALNVRDELKQRYSMSVNSVLYFIQLPYGLNDPAARKTYLGEVEIKGEPYHKVRVAFGQDGGGVDFEDVFMYWFHKEKKTMDYLAYSYLTEGGGLRFREAYNQRTENGIRFADYVNYKADHKKHTLEKIDQLYVDDQLEELSRINSEKINVRLLLDEGQE